MSDLELAKTVLIEASPKEVYDYVSDIRRHTEWNYQPQEITKVSEGPVDVGARFHTKEELPREMSWFMKKLSPLLFKLMGTSDYTVAEITAMEPNQRFAWKSWQPIRDGRALEVDWEIRLEPQNGATRLTQHSRWVPKHSMSDPNMLADEAEAEIENNLNRLKQTLEA